MAIMEVFGIHVFSIRIRILQIIKICYQLLVVIVVVVLSACVAAAPCRGAAPSHGPGPDPDPGPEIYQLSGRPRYSVPDKFS